jgi:hypothetical protein
MASLCQDRRRGTPISLPTVPDRHAGLGSWHLDVLWWFLGFVVEADHDPAGDRCLRNGVIEPDHPDGTNHNRPNGRDDYYFGRRAAPDLD